MDKPNYRKLIVWQKAHKNALAIISLSDKIHYKFSGIMIQCLNAATSIGANIAEGNAAFSKKEKQRYFKIALNSGYEIDNWLQILKDSDNICTDTKSLVCTEEQNIEVIKMLTKLTVSLSS